MPLIMMSWSNARAAKCYDHYPHRQQWRKLTTLDDIERTLDDTTVLVCDTKGALSIAGVMEALNRKSVRKP